MNKLPQPTLNIIRRRYLAGPINKHQLARELGVSLDTIKKRVKQLQEIERYYPGKLKDFNFYPPKRVRPRTLLYTELLDALPELIEQATMPRLQIEPLWRDYKRLYPKGYCLFHFSVHVTQWFNAHQVCPYYHKRIRYIAPAEEQELMRWRTTPVSSDLWRRAVVVLDSAKGRPLAEMAKQVERSEETLLRWIADYQLKGIKGLIYQHVVNPEITARTQLKQQRLVMLLQQSPAIYGFNRASWRHEDLAQAYTRVYQEPISRCCVAQNLYKAGYRFQKSRERLTSPDPKFQEKINHIKSVLAALQPDEKFFSIDEYGPARVVKKTGWSMTAPGEVKTVPSPQQAKYTFILTAALELSTNQVTHFYSSKKDTAEMIILIERLLLQYSTDRMLYLSWDAAPWHTSFKLKSYLATINSEAYRTKHQTPQVELAPLPACTQHLNVIESVFGGMARAVIHNSDYPSFELCKAAIDHHFSHRNAYFLLHPKHAGGKLWGKETVKPVFSELHNCKSRKISRPAS